MKIHLIRDEGFKEEISMKERGEIESALLKYCELDTMVMIMEAWREMIKNNIL
jgi:predicted NUDIX family phosphoesterase